MGLGERSGIWKQSLGAENGTSRVRVVFEKTGCEMVEPEGSARDLFALAGRRVELRDGLGALRDGVLGELAGEDEADGRLDLARS